MFEWVFSDFLKTRSPNAFNRLGVSEKTVYAWCYPSHLPHARKNPIDRAVEILDVIFDLEPGIGFNALMEIANRYGYRLEKLPEDDEVKFSELVKELHDVVQREAEAREDGKITPEEAEDILKELKEAELVIAREKARLRELIQRYGVRR